MKYFSMWSRILQTRWQLFCIYISWSPRRQLKSSKIQAACLSVRGKVDLISLLLKMTFLPFFFFSFSSCLQKTKRWWCDFLSWGILTSPSKLLSFLILLYHFSPNFFFYSIPPSYYIFFLIPFHFLHLRFFPFPALHPACLFLSSRSPPLCHLISRINGFISIVSSWWWIMSLIIISPGWRIMSLIRIFFLR